MKISTEMLRSVVAIADCGGLNKAAARLNKAPSTLSHALQRYEQDLGVAVFERAGKRLILTRAGEQLIERGRLLLEQMSELEHDILIAEEGWDDDLRVAVADVVPKDWLIANLAPLRGKYPRTNVVVTLEVLSGTWDAVLSARADLTVGAPLTPPAGTDLERRFLGNIDFVMAVAPSHPLAGETEPVSKHRLRRYAIAVIPDTSRTLQPMTFNVAPYQPHIVVPDMSTKIMVQRQGLAYGSLPRHLIREDLASGDLVEIDIAYDNWIEPLYLAWKKGNAGGPLTHLRERLEEADKPWVL